MEDCKKENRNQQYQVKVAFYHLSVFGNTEINDYLCNVENCGKRPTSMMTDTTNQMNYITNQIRK